MNSSPTGPVSLRGSSVSPTNASLVKPHVSTASLRAFQNSLLAHPLHYKKLS